MDHDNNKNNHPHFKPDLGQAQLKLGSLNVVPPQISYLPTVYRDDWPRALNSAPNGSDLYNPI